jgi:phosphoglycolate phosphatase
MYRYYLFDLDGTISKSDPGIFNCIKYALDWAQMPCPSDDVLRTFIGPSLYDSFMKHFDIDNEQALALVAKYRERYNVIGLYETEIYDGIYDTLEQLKARGNMVAVATSKPTGPTKDILKKFQLDTYFDVVIGSNPDGTGSDKQMIIAEALKQLISIDKNDNNMPALMIGDRMYDIKGGQACGIDTVGVLYGFGSREEFEEAGATYIVERPEDILEL